MVIALATLSMFLCGVSRSQVRDSADSLSALFADSTTNVEDPAAWLREHGHERVHSIGIGPSRQVFLVGDDLVLNADSFPALYSRPGTGHSDVARLVIDARRIYVDMELALVDGMVVLLGDEIVFGPRGRITIIRPPQETPQGVEIITNELDLAAAPRSAWLNFRTRDWRGSAGWDPAALATRTVRIVAQHMTVGDNDPLGLLRADPARFLHNLSQDRGQSASSAVPWHSQYEVSLGDSAAEQFNTALVDRMRWPESTVGALVELYGVAPFSQHVREFILDASSKWQAMFAERSDPSAYIALQTLTELIASDRDVFGMGRYQVPMTNLDDAIEAFEGSLAEAFGCSVGVCDSGLLHDWDLRLLDSWTGRTSTEQRIAAIGETLGAVQSLQARRQELVVTMDESEIRQNFVYQEIANLDRNIETRRVEIQRSVEAEQARERDQELISDIASLAIEVTANVAGGPVAGAAASTVLSAMEARRQGSPFSLTDALVTFDEMYSIHREAEERFKTIRTEFKTIRDSTTSGVEKLIRDDFETGLETISDARGRVEGFLDDLENFVDFSTGHRNLSFANEPDFQQAFRADQQLQSYLTHLSSAHRDLENEQRTWIASSEELLLLDQSLLERAAELYELQRLNVTEIGSAISARDLALHMRTRLLRELSREAAGLLRRYQYATGHSLPMPAAYAALGGRSLVFADLPGMSDVLGAAPIEPTSAASVGDLADALATQRRDARTYYQQLLGLLPRNRAPASNIELRSYVTRPANLAARGDKQAIRDAAFLEAINLDIERQISEPGANPAVLPVPYAVDVPATSSLAVLSVVLGDVELDNPLPPGTELLVGIIHPGYGFVNYNGTRYFVVDATPRPRSEDYSTAPEPMSWKYQVHDNRFRYSYADVIQVAAYLGGLTSLAYPMEAQYYLYVRVLNPENWPRGTLPPRLIDIALDFVGIPLHTRD